jgi:hypothetical protein
MGQRGSGIRAARPLRRTGGRVRLVLRSEQQDQGDGQSGEDQDRDGGNSGATASLPHRRRNSGIGRAEWGLVAGRSFCATPSVFGREGTHGAHPVVLVERLPPASVL